MTRRRGISLSEVLVALFIMALGTIAILTLFPLGAMQMGQALKDDRTAQAAAAGDAYFRWYWKVNVVETGGGTGEPFVRAMNNPMDPVGPNAATQAIFPTPASDMPSYPVVVDPMGTISRAGRGDQNWIGDAPALVPPPRVPRRTLNIVTGQAASLQATFATRICTLLDGLTYDGNQNSATAGTPQPNAISGGLDRELRYNWLWVVQRPRNGDMTTANLTVVVFDKRAPQFAPAGSEAVYTPTPAPPAPPVVVPVVFTPGSTTVSLNYGGSRPNLVKGNWIMDGTVAPAGRPNIRHAYFYRVVSVTENTAGVLDIELQTPVRQPTDANASPYNGTLVVMAGVSEVFERQQPLSPADLTQ